MIYYETGSPETTLSADDLRKGMNAALNNIGERQKVLIVPPEITSRYNPETLKEGYNTLPDGEEVYYISNPALGLWAFKDRFNY